MGENANFLEALAASQSKQRDMTPLQQIHHWIGLMKVRAQEGDLEGWVQQKGTLEELLSSMSLDAFRELELQVEVARQEMDLFLSASRNSMIEAKENEQRAQDAKARQDEEEAKDCMARSHRLVRQSQCLQEQLLAKTA